MPAAVRGLESPSAIDYCLQRGHEGTGARCWLQIVLNVCPASLRPVCCPLEDDAGISVWELTA